MKKNAIIFCLSFCGVLLTNCKSGLVTMTNGCYNAINAAGAQNAAGNYSAALDQYNQVLSQCKAYDAKEKAYAGAAEAYNGLQQYSSALNAANQGLGISNTSIDNLFQKARAELGLNMQPEAKADFATIIDVTTKNRNVKDRATIYAKIAQIDVQQKMYTDAMNNLQTAIGLDNTNTDFYILKGDIYAAQNDYANALAAYDEASAYGSNDSKVWQAKIEAETKAFQRKYSTGSNAAALAGKMSAADKKSFCDDIAGAKTHGVKNQSIDLLEISICK